MRETALQASLRAFRAEPLPSTAIGRGARIRMSDDMEPKHDMEFLRVFLDPSQFRCVQPCHLPVKYGSMR